ncbi:MAG: 3-oxoacyl-[acyl-carrier-protein] reductase [Treponema sp.]|nr:3-oxoacyl-[acyl-carrier-protein] reductase [Treponema sp.]
MLEHKQVLSGKKALVTGASRGIGKAISVLFLAEGAEVWGIGRREPEDLAERASGGKFHWISADLSLPKTLEDIAEASVSDSGGFDILVNNAGITKDNLSFRMKLEDFQKVLDVNLTASFIFAKIIGRDMIHRRTGSIINMSSVVGVHGNGGQANYAASKAGLIGMTKSLARESASRNVRVNAIAPGIVETGMTDILPGEVKEKLLEQVPLKRMGKPEDIAETALFLASDASAYITGQVLAVDGGMFM